MIHMGQSRGIVSKGTLAELLELTVVAVDVDPKGYPQLATFKSSDLNSLQFRSFSYLHTRVLLALQQDIEDLERYLDAHDKFDASGDGDRHKLRSWRHDTEYPTLNEIKNAKFRFSKTRPQVIRELQERLLEYGPLCPSCDVFHD